MGSSLDIYKFDRLTPLLADVSARPLSEGRRPLSLQNWANRLGYRSPRSIGMVFRGQRLPSVMMINRLSKLLKLNFEEKEYLFALLAFEKLKHNGRDAEDLQKIIEDHNPTIRDEQILDTSKHEILTDWCHIVIRQLIGERPVALSASAIQKRLKGKASVNQVQRALSNLRRHGLIFYDPIRGTYHRKAGSLVTAADVPSKVVRQYHRQILERAIEAIEEEPVDQREFATATFAFDRKHINEVKQLIRKFRDRIEKLYTSQDPADVYQLSLQFFSHTTKP